MDNNTSVTSVNILQQRSSGILLPVFSLPGPCGIGEIGASARQFIDFLKECGQSCWQILPLGPTSPMFGNSPYMSYSAFAGSPLMIGIEVLIEQGLLKDKEIPPRVWSEYGVEYDAVAACKRELLRIAWGRFQSQAGNEDVLRSFIANHPWTVDYGLFLTLKAQFRGEPWYKWPLPLRQRQPETLAQTIKQLDAEIRYHIFEQYLFFTQWGDLRDYANQQGIRIIGDLPIYVALDSVDVWSNQQLFQLHPSSGEPTHVAGVPPDYFSATGQRWGNPLYHWHTENPTQQKLLWNWWEYRLRLNFSLVDTLRIDHFRGFESYWAVPAEEETALNGQWLKGPGQPFFEEMDRRLNGMSIIAEDLGLITPSVEALRQNLEYPGMKILLFAFDGDPNNSYLPYNIEKNSVIYTGTHDNDTAVGWYLNPDVAPESKRRAKRFANRSDDDAGSFHHDLMHLALSSSANLAILPMQDVLGFGNDCRLNTPGTIANNWQWRCAERFMNEGVAAWLRDLTGLFGRLPPIAPAQEQKSESNSLVMQEEPPAAQPNSRGTGNQGAPRDS